jgi:hypothetical protein
MSGAGSRQGRAAEAAASRDRSSEWPSSLGSRGVNAFSGTYPRDADDHRPGRLERICSPGLSARTPSATRSLMVAVDKMTTIELALK